MNDRASWVAFNLPVGTVFTLAQHTYRSQGCLPGDLSDIGAVVDLIGTGQTVGVDLSQLGLDDEITGFFWRNVDLSQGVIELFVEPGFSGNRANLFLSEWNQAELVSFDRWYIGNRARSVRWKTLQETMTALLFDRSDGTGTPYSNIKGWGSIKEVEDLGQVGYDKRVSGFSWKNVTPEKEIIDLVSVDLSPYIRNAEEFRATTSGQNRTTVEQRQTVTIDKSQAETVTVEVSNTVSVGTEITASYSVNGAITSWSMSITLSFSYSTTTTKSTSVTKTSDISVSQEFVVPPRTTFQALFTQQMAVLPPNTHIQTTATRWYKDPVPGSTMDSSERNLYKRVETISLNLSCSVAVGTTFDIDAEPLDAPEPPEPPPPPPPPPPGPDGSAEAVRKYWSAYWKAYWYPYWKEAVNTSDPPKAPPPPAPTPPNGPRSKHFKKIYKAYWSAHWEEFFRKKLRQSS